MFTIIFAHIISQGFVMPTIYVQPASAFPATTSGSHTAPVSALHVPRGMTFSAHNKSDGLTHTGDKWGSYTVTLCEEVFAGDKGPEWHTALSDRSMLKGLHSWEVVIPGADEEAPHTGHEVVSIIIINVDLYINS